MIACSLFSGSECENDEKIANTEMTTAWNRVKARLKTLSCV